MIVIAKRVGRLANRLLLFSHVIAAAREHGLTVWNPAFEHYARYFPTTARNLVPRWPPGRPLLSFPTTIRKVSYRAWHAQAEVAWRLRRRGWDAGVIRLTREERLDLNSEAFVSMARGHRALFIQDWFFRNTENCERHADLLRAYFTPHPRRLERARAAADVARAGRRLVIGVHVRRGDYREFKQGRFLFAHDTYRRAMEQAEAAHGDRDVAFVVSSDEPVPPGTFAGLDVTAAPGSELEDLYALASCDRVIGPPSTYNRWASFWGDVPLFEIRGSDPSLSREAFGVARGLSWEPRPAAARPYG